MYYFCIILFAFRQGTAKQEGHNRTQAFIENYFSFIVKTLIEREQYFVLVLLSVGKRRGVCVYVWVVHINQSGLNHTQEPRTWSVGQRKIRAIYTKLQR